MNKNDRELLELAAKVSGLPIQFNSFMTQPIICTGNEQDGDPVVFWNPLVDRHDAFNLMVKLNMQVECSRGWQHVTVYGYAFEIDEHHGGIESASVTMRAIVRAAAEVARRENL